MAEERTGGKESAYWDETCEVWEIYCGHLMADSGWTTLKGMEQSLAARAPEELHERLVEQSSLIVAGDLLIHRLLLIRAILDYYATWGARPDRFKAYIQSEAFIE